MTVTPGSVAESSVLDCCSVCSTMWVTVVVPARRPERGWLRARRPTSGVDAAQARQLRELARHDPLVTVAQGLLEDTDVADQVLDALGLAGGRPNRPPPGAVKGDVPRVRTSGRR